MVRSVGVRSSGGGKTFSMKVLRTALAGSVAAAALLAAGLDPASAAHRKPAHARTAKKESRPKWLEQPLIEISLARQQLTLYDKGQVIAHAPVSTGMAGHLTPTGIFSVLEKEVFHRSNIYSGAPMPYMQRITWSGVALHAGVLPGYPASHGCIRMPPAFAIRLFHMTQRGARVLVVRNEVAPVPFESPRLFTRPKPADKLGDLVAPASRPDLVARTAQARTVMNDAVGIPHAAATPTDAARDHAKAAAPAGLRGAAPPIMSGAAAIAADAHAPPEPTLGRDDTRPAASQTVAASTVQNRNAATGSVLASPVKVTPEHPIGVEKTLAPSVAPAEPAVLPAVAPAPIVVPAPVVTASLELYGPERPLRRGPITVFISKKEGKLYVRKAFQPVFSAPVSILHPEQPLGTHLYTAVEQSLDGVSFHWLAVTLPSGQVARKRTEVARYVIIRGRKVRKVEKVNVPAPPSATAAEALERIDIPPAARERISALMSPGASLIISDKGLGGETGSETDFIVLTGR